MSEDRYNTLLKSRNEILQNSSRCLQWGTLLKSIAKRKDKGPHYFQKIVAAREQLERIVQQSYPTASVYVFGSSVVHQIWDGSSDIDFTCIDPEAWNSNRWPPDERIAVLKSSATLGLLAKPQSINAITLARVPILKYTGVEIDGPSQATTPEGVATLQSTIVLTFRKPGFGGPQLKASQDVVESELKNLVKPDTVLDVKWNESGEEARVHCSSCHAAVHCFIIVKTRSKIGPAPLLSVKFVSPTDIPDVLTVDFDLSFRAFGLRNSYLLQKYMNASAVVRPGAQVLKEWSKITGLNNSASGWLCTYAFNVMWLHFLLQKNIIPFVPPESIPKEPSNLPTCPTYSSIELKESECEQLGRLITEFFLYFSNDFDWENQVVTINRYEPTPKSALNWGLNQPRNNSFHYFMSIEDPYEINFNLGRHMTRDRFMFVKKKFSETLVGLVEENPNDSSLFCTAQMRSEQNQLESISKILHGLLPEPNSNADIRQVVHAFRDAKLFDDLSLQPNRLRKLLPSLGFWITEGRVYHNSVHVRDLSRKRKTEEIPTTAPHHATKFGGCLPIMFDTVPQPTATWVQRFLRRRR